MIPVSVSIIFVWLLVSFTLTVFFTRMTCCMYQAVIKCIFAACYGQNLGGKRVGLGGRHRLVNYCFLYLQRYEEFLPPYLALLHFLSSFSIFTSCFVCFVLLLALFLCMCFPSFCLAGMWKMECPTNCHIYLLPSSWNHSF